MATWDWKEVEKPRSFDLWTASEQWCWEEGVRDGLAHKEAAAAIEDRLPTVIVIHEGEEAGLSQETAIAVDTEKEPSTKHNT